MNRNSRLVIAVAAMALGSVSSLRAAPPGAVAPPEALVDVLSYGVLALLAVAGCLEWALRRRARGSAREGNRPCRWIRAAGLLFSTMVLSLQAQTAVFTNNYSGTPNFSGTLRFDKFNPNTAGGEYVTQVVISSSIHIDGFALTVSNVGAVNATLDEYSFGARNRMVIVPIGATNTLTAANSDSPGTVIAPQEAVTINGSHQQAGYTWVITSSNQMSGFVGEGTFDVTYSATQTKTVSTSGSTQDVLSPSTAWGSVIVSFFTAIPEPSTYAMIGCGALFLLVLKGQRREP